MDSDSKEEILRYYQMFFNRQAYFPNAFNTNLIPSLALSSGRTIFSVNKLHNVIEFCARQLKNAFTYFAPRMRSCTTQPPVK
jgi:hypothetical protein